jgi:hypothetical protein
MCLHLGFLAGVISAGVLVFRELYITVADLWT